MPRERRVTHGSGTHVDARVAQRAARQWTIVDVADLRACGLSDRAIAGRVGAGRLYPFHRGVYSVVPNPPLEGCFLAAVKACGPRAVLSHDAPAAARADDGARQAVLEAEGFTVLRTTWREITTRPDRVVARVRAALEMLERDMHAALTPAGDALGRRAA